MTPTPAIALRQRFAGGYALSDLRAVAGPLFFELARRLAARSLDAGTPA